MKDFKFLTTINGIYNVDTEAEDFNITSMLLVYGNDDCHIKVIYKELTYYSEREGSPFNTNEGEFYLDDLGEMVCEEIFNNLTSDYEFERNLAKRLIFAVHNDFQGRHLNFSKIF